LTNETFASGRGSDADMGCLDPFSRPLRGRLQLSFCGAVSDERIVSTSTEDGAKWMTDAQPGKVVYL